MKSFLKHITTSTISFLICFTAFLSIMLCSFLPDKSKEKTVLKNEQSIAYEAPQFNKTVSIKITIKGCPVAFLLKILPKSQKLSVTCFSEHFENKNKRKTEKLAFYEYSKQINFSLSGFENTVNFLGGVEIETPFGLPSPAKNNSIIAKDEKLFVYGASLGTLLCEETSPTNERKDYCCYILGELCLKFLNEGSTDAYKCLKENSKTDISYADYYDNYKSLKKIIKYADITNSQL